MVCPTACDWIDRDLTSLVHDLRNLHEILIPSLGLPYAFQVIVERLLTRFLSRS